MLRGKGGTPSHPIAVPFARVDPPRGEGKGREGRRGGRGGFVDDLNARSGNVWGGGMRKGWRASKELEICYVMSSDHSPASMKKDFFFFLLRFGWDGGSSLDSGRSPRVGRPFPAEEEEARRGRGW